MEMANRCGNCHAELSQQFMLSVHGELTNLGYGPAAKCADCHGDHEIHKKSDPRSMVSSVNLQATCSKCHPGATANFLKFDPHADHHDRAKNPLLNAVYLVLMTFLIGTFAVFGVHSILWLIRGIFDVAQHGRPKIPAPGDVAYVRFKPAHRAAHALLFTSFLGLALTGLPLKYSHIPWARWLADLLGGFESTSMWHRIFGLVNVLCLAVYVVRLGFHLVAASLRPKTVGHVVFGPESPVPNKRDFKDFFRMVRWFFGLGPRPTFERWAYWEKFDFWGAAADIVIIGSTGLVLWFPVWFCQYLPGEAVNIAKVIHSTQALLATGFVFAIHFYSVFIRPDKFPMDMAMLTGMVSEEELQHERPEYFERLKREGRLENRRTFIPSRRATLLATIGGYTAFAIGTALLVGMIAAALASR
jgi:cytochrome b subunit of formate dehydrogenase